MEKTTYYDPSIVYQESDKKYIVRIDDLAVKTGEDSKEYIERNNLIIQYNFSRGMQGPWKNPLHRRRRQEKRPELLQ
jgi:hypothetical protein